MNKYIKYTALILSSLSALAQDEAGEFLFRLVEAHVKFTVEAKSDVVAGEAFMVERTDALSNLGAISAFSMGNLDKYAQTRDFDAAHQLKLQFDSILSYVASKKRSDKEIRGALNAASVSKRNTLEPKQTKVIVNFVKLALAKASGDFDRDIEPYIPMLESFVDTLVDRVSQEDLPKNDDFFNIIDQTTTLGYLKSVFPMQKDENDSLLQLMKELFDFALTRLEEFKSGKRGYEEWVIDTKFLDSEAVKECSALVFKISNAMFAKEVCQQYRGQSDKSKAIETMQSVFNGCLNLMLEQKDRGVSQYALLCILYNLNSLCSNYLLLFQLLRLSIHHIFPVATVDFNLHALGVCFGIQHDLESYKQLIRDITGYEILNKRLYFTVKPEDSKAKDSECIYLRSDGAMFETVREFPPLSSVSSVQDKSSVIYYIQQAIDAKTLKDFGEAMYQMSQNALDLKMFKKLNLSCSNEDREAAMKYSQGIFREFKNWVNELLNNHGISIESLNAYFAHMTSAFIYQSKKSGQSVEESLGPAHLIRIFFNLLSSGHSSDISVSMLYFWYNNSEEYTKGKVIRMMQEVTGEIFPDKTFMI
jgi:hypothetical protein